jgi:hypothetical protein
MNEILQLLNNYEDRHFHSDYDGFNKLELYNDGSGSLRDPEGKIIFEFESLEELTQKLKE